MVISAYASTITSCKDNKEAFCENLISLVRSIPASDKLIVQEDFNTRVGSDCES